MSRHAARRFLAVVLPVLAVAVGVHAALRNVPATSPNQVVEIAPGVYFRHGDLDGHGHCNNGFVVFEKFVLVVDANFPDGAEVCLADIRKVTDKPVRFVFDTHHHGDHAYGNPVWIDNGALPVAHRNVVGEMRRYEPARWRQAAASREDVGKLGLDSAVPPVITFPDRMVIDDGTQRVELLHFGTAHTRGDGFAYLPRHRVLFTGDAVVNGPYNYMGDGNTHSWLRVLDALEELDVDVIAPGHGQLAKKSLIEAQRNYILALHAAVEQGIAEGKPVAELRETITLPDSVSRYVGRMFRDQITKVYSEKKGLEMPLELEELGLVSNPSTARPGKGWKPPKKVVVRGPERWREDFELVAPGVKVVFANDHETLLGEMADADAIIGTASNEIIDRGKNLRWVHSYSAGVNQYIGVGDPSMPGIEKLVDSDIVLTNGKRCYGPEIADQAIGSILAFSRWLKSSIEGKHDLRGGASHGDARRPAWRAVDPGDREEMALRGREMLVVGVGGIGSEVALRAAACGMRVTGIDPAVQSPPPGVTRLRKPAALLEELPRADVVVIACPWTRQTHGLFGKRHFEAMRPGAILVNVARGPIVQRQALIEALRSGKLLGAALDVTDPEPLPDDDPLWKIPNVIITPHNAGQSEGTARRRFLLARENLRRFAAGEAMLNVVDKRRGY